MQNCYLAVALKNGVKTMDENLNRQQNRTIKHEQKKEGTAKLQ
ncbi:hypothetical protein [Bacillus thuringiensis]|nr:hypothetical protein [Bacillus thuringiensis]